MFGSFKPHFAADFERLVCTERNQITSLATELCAKDGNEIDRAPVTMIMPAKNTFLNIAHPFDVGMSRPLLNLVQQALLVDQATQPWPSVQGRG